MERTVMFLTEDGSIHCEGCERRIHKALTRVPGVLVVQASATCQQVRVSYEDGDTSTERLSAKLNEIGFPNQGQDQVDEQ